METTAMEYYILFWIMIIGFCLGSFYNVVIIRSLSEESIVFPPSKCPKCGQKLKPWHNIPVLSYIFLNGKCAFCKEKISIQYPIVELITGLLFGLIFYKFGMSCKTLFCLFWVSCLIIMTGTDIKAKIVDCNFAIAMALSGIIYSFINAGVLGIKNSIIGGVAGFLIIEAIAWLGHILKKGRAMGEADSYVTCAFGTIAGYQFILQVFIYSLFAAMFVLLPIFWYQRYKANDVLSMLLSIIFVLGIAFNILFNSAIWTVLLLIFAGIGLTICIIRNLKQNSEALALPFVPALSTGFLYFLIFVL